MNWPRPRAALQDLAALTDQAFRIAAERCTEDEIIGLVQSWIEEDRALFLMRALQSPHGDLQEIGEALERFHAASIRETLLAAATQKSLRASLLRRLFSDDPDYIVTAQECVDLAALREILWHTICPPKNSR